MAYAARDPGCRAVGDDEPAFDDPTGNPAIGAAAVRDDARCPPSASRAIRRHLRHGMLPQLAVFEAVARLGSFTRAAEEMHLAQPTVSTQIRKLSETLELVLFEQVGKKIHLTPAGRILHEGCRSLFAQFARIDESLAGLRRLDGGRLRIAAGTAGAQFVPRLLAAFVAAHPKVEVSLEIANRRGLIERLAANEDDLYLFANPPQRHEIVRLPVLPNPMVVFARADHPLAMQRRIRVDALAGEPFLMREEGSGTRRVAEEAFERHGIAPPVRLVLSNDEAIRQSVLAGLGIAILPRFSRAARPDDEGLVVLDVEGFPIERTWYLAYPVGKQVSSATRAFIALVRDQGRRLLATPPAPAPAQAADAIGARTMASGERGGAQFPGSVISRQFSVRGDSIRR